MDIDVAAVPVGESGIMRGDGVRAALVEYGTAVIAVVATGGSTNFGIVDDIASIAALKDDHDFWLHIDGAYGLAAALTDIISWWGIKYVSPNFDYVTMFCGAVYGGAYLWMLIGIVRVIFFPSLRWLPDYINERRGK